MKGTKSVPEAVRDVLFCLNFEPTTVFAYFFFFSIWVSSIFFTPVCVGLPLYKLNNRNVGTCGCNIMQ